MHRTLSTILCWQEAGADREACANVVYAIHKGSPQTMIDPAEPDAVEIISITGTEPNGTPIPDSMVEDEELLEECYQHYREDLIAAEEYRAEQRAEQRRDDMMERW